MCTAVTYKTKDFYFGRNLDYEHSFDECIAVTPRNFPLNIRCCPPINNHYAIIGMAKVVGGEALYFDAVNEKGLCAAGLNFPNNAVYNEALQRADNITPFEFIPWILSQCNSVSAARKLLKKMNVVNIPYSEDLPLTPLHWIIADRDGCITAEPTEEGLCVYENPVGVLTNNPPFPMQMMFLNNYMGVSARSADNRFCPDLPLDEYSRGMGGIGLPGDLSSLSRFVRAAFGRCNSVSGDGETESVSQFFHILSTVEQIRGCNRVEGRMSEITIYSSCCNAERGLYYYKTYDNSTIHCVDMYAENLDGREVKTYPLKTEAEVIFQN